MSMSEINTKTYVGIIGAGISGLTTAYQLKQHGIDFEILEADDEVGGVWRQKSYDECFLITSRKATYLSGSTQPEEYPDFPSAKQFQQYIRNYAHREGLAEHIRFNTPVAKACPREQEWEVEIQDGSVRRFSHLVVCAGLNRDPFIPDYPGTFAGEVIHSADYKNFDQLRGKRVLVVGAGNSACDIAVEAGRVGECSHISMRSGRWLFPKYSMGIPITDFQGKAPFWAQKLFARFMIKMHTGRNERFGLPKPDHKLFYETATVSQQLPYMLKHGLVKVKAGVECMENASVAFKDGSKEEYDLIVYGTGFTPNLAFIDEQFLSRTKMGPWEHRRLFSKEYRNLFLNGFYINNGAFTQVANAAAELIATCIAYPAHANKVVSDDIKKHPGEFHANHVINNRARHILELRKLVKKIRKRAAVQGSPSPATKKLVADGARENTKVESPA